MSYLRFLLLQCGSFSAALAARVGRQIPMLHPLFMKVGRAVTDVPTPEQLPITFALFCVSISLIMLERLLPSVTAWTPLFHDAMIGQSPRQLFAKVVMASPKALPCLVIVRQRSPFLQYCVGVVALPYTSIDRDMAWVDVETRRLRIVAAHGLRRLCSPRACC